MGAAGPCTTFSAAAPRWSAFAMWATCALWNGVRQPIRRRPVLHPMGVDYDHSANRHTLEGPRAAWAVLFPEGLPASILDVGCGQGTWLRTAMERGVEDVFGVDGVPLPADQLLFPAGRFHCYDLGSKIE